MDLVSRTAGSGGTQTLKSNRTSHLEHTLVDEPFQLKPPVVTVIVMLLVLLNLILHRHNKRALTRFIDEWKSLVERVTCSKISAAGQSIKSNPRRRR